MEDNFEETQEMDNLVEPSEVTVPVEDAPDEQGDNIPEWQAKFRDPDEMFTSYKTLENKLGEQGQELGEVRQLLRSLAEERAPKEQPRSYDADPRFNNPDSLAAVDFIKSKLGVDQFSEKLSTVEKQLNYALDRNNFRDFKDRHSDLTDAQLNALWEIGGKQGNLPDYEKLYSDILRPALEQATAETRKSVETKRRAKTAPSKVSTPSSGKISGEDMIAAYKSGDPKKIEQVVSEYRNSLK